ncbi:hypothetical protein L208DRAFT_1306433, partial [Tricholoma matsutake]
PLPSPPQHLLDDPAIQTSLQSLGDYIKVETPFNVDKLELLLVSHPNRPFVQSVMKGLQEGFWPFDEGEWKIELEEVTPNYVSDPEDAEAIHAFRDREVAAGRWSDPLASTELLPGMKETPCLRAHCWFRLSLLQLVVEQGFALRLLHLTVSTTIYIVRVFTNLYKLYAQLGSHFTGFSWFSAVATTTSWILVVSKRGVASFRPPSRPQATQLVVEQGFASRASSPIHFGVRFGGPQFTLHSS